MRPQTRPANPTKLPTEATVQEMLEEFRSFPRNLQLSTDIFPTYATRKVWLEALAQQDFGRFRDERQAIPALRELCIANQFMDESLSPVFLKLGDDHSGPSLPIWANSKAKTAYSRSAWGTRLLVTERKARNAEDLYITIENCWEQILKRTIQAQNEHFLEYLFNAGYLQQFSERELVEQIAQRKDRFNGPFFILATTDLQDFWEETTGTGRQFENNDVISLGSEVGESYFVSGVIAQDQFKVNHNFEIWTNHERIPRNASYPQQE